MVEAQARLDERLSYGSPLAEVEKEIIDSAPVGEEQRAALLLCASATTPVHLAEAVGETARRPSLPPGSAQDPALRSAGSMTLSRMGSKAQRRRGEGL